MEKSGSKEAQSSPYLSQATRWRWHAMNPQPEGGIFILAHPLKACGPGVPSQTWTQGLKRAGPSGPGLQDPMPSLLSSAPYAAVTPKAAKLIRSCLHLFLMMFI